MNKVALVTNARSHRVARKGSRLEAVAREMSSLPLLRFEDISAFDAALTDQLSQGVDTLFIEGGDGTVLAALTSCYNHDPKAFSGLRFALLPGGSTNLAHEKLGLKDTSAERIADLIRAMEADEPPKADTTSQAALIVETGEGERPQVGFLLSSGVVPLAMDHVQTHMFGETSRGAGAIASSLIRLAARPRHFKGSDGEPLLRPTRLELQRPDFPIEAGPHAFTLVTSLSSLTLGIAPFWGEGDGPIRFTYAPWPPAKLRRAILRSATRFNPKALERDGYRSLNIGALSMSVDGPLMLDGELLALDQSTSVRVSTTDRVEWLR